MIDAASVMAGMAVLPALGLLWWLLWRARRWLRARSQFGSPRTIGRRAGMAARVYAGHRVLLLRFPGAAFAMSIGANPAEERRASHVLMAEFTAAPHAAARPH